MNVEIMIPTHSLPEASERVDVEPKCEKGKKASVRIMIRTLSLSEAAERVNIELTPLRVRKGRKRLLES